MPWRLLILGSNAAMPNNGRITTSQVLLTESDYYQIDCGEATQMRLSQYKVKRNRIRAIFISHLHGDHIFGLPGLITSYFHFSRKDDLHIIGPPGIKEFVETVVRLSESHLAFKLHITELEAKEKTLVYTDNTLEVFAFPLQHRIPTNGYLFKEKSEKTNIRKDKIHHYNLSVEEILQLKAEEEVHRADQTVIQPAEVLHPRKHPHSYAFCSDTKYHKGILEYIQGVDLLYHESTYLHELVDKAAERGHATAKEAALTAKAARVEKLVIGHYSGKYRDVHPLLEEAKEIFENTVRAYDGEFIDFPEK